MHPEISRDSLPLGRLHPDSLCGADTNQITILQLVLIIVQESSNVLFLN